LQGTSSLDIGAGAGNGLVAFSDLRLDVAGTNRQLTASATGLTGATSSVFVVSASGATHLVMITQPGATATAGVAFSPAPAVALADAFGNITTSDSSTPVTVVRAAGTAALQGVISATAMNGVATFSNISYNKAETITLAFNSGSLSGVTSSS